MPKRIEWAEGALKITHVIHDPGFYIAYGYLQEAARALALAKTFKHHKEAVPRFEVALKAATDRYCEAFDKEVAKIGYDPLLTSEIDCVRCEGTENLQVEVRSVPSSGKASYWPAGPTDLPSINKLDRLSYWPALKFHEMKEMDDPEDVQIALLERHLRIRAFELTSIATSRTPRDAWRDAKRILDECQLEAEAAQSPHRVILGKAGNLVHHCFAMLPHTSGRKEHILEVASTIASKADELGEKLRRRLLGESHSESFEYPVFVRAIR